VRTPPQPMSGQPERTGIANLAEISLVDRQGQRLAGMPPIGFLGHTVLRLSSALREARSWKQFRVRLCPSLAGVELLKDGGFYEATLHVDGDRPAEFKFRRLPRH